MNKCNFELLYHVTPERNIDSIKENGLIPKYKRGLSTRPHPLEAVWITNNPCFILENQAGENWCRKNRPIIIPVISKYLDVRRVVYDYNGTFSLFEFYVCGVIDKEFLII